MTARTSARRANPRVPRPVTFDRWPYPRRVAHRGAGKRAPENTLAAIRLGFGHGYRMFEFDVKLAADGTLYLMHDATLDRTTSGAGPLAGLEWSVLAALDAGSWHSKGFAGEPLARFDSVERFLRANRLLADVEIKPVPGQDAETGAAVAAHCARAWATETVPPILTSFSRIALEAAGREAPDLPRGLLLGEARADWVDHARSLGCVAVAFKERVIDAALVARARDARLRVMAYTVNRAARVRTLDRLGVDCIITDAVDKIAAHPGAAR
ncbi:MAG: glycerophosphodiester phosphodiesterase [Burkholderiaceae bacterium]